MRLFYCFYMQISFEYNKNKTIQALRYHFISRKEIRVMIVLVNVFAIVSAILFYTKKIRPEPFLLGTFIWVMMMVSIWYILPFSIYRKTKAFKEKFMISFNEREVILENEEGFVEWQWSSFSKYLESPHFFHLYFNEKSFFLIPKEVIREDVLHDLRSIFKNKIGKV